MCRNVRIEEWKKKKKKKKIGKMTKCDLAVKLKQEIQIYKFKRREK